MNTAKEALPPTLLSTGPSFNLVKKDCNNGLSYNALAP